MSTTHVVGILLALVVWAISWLWERDKRDRENKRAYYERIRTVAWYDRESISRCMGETLSGKEIVRRPPAPQGSDGKVQQAPTQVIQR